MPHFETKICYKIGENIGGLIGLFSYMEHSCNDVAISLQPIRFLVIWYKAMLCMRFSHLNTCIATAHFTAFNMIVTP